MTYKALLLAMLLCSSALAQEHTPGLSSPGEWVPGTASGGGAAVRQEISATTLSGLCDCFEKPWKSPDVRQRVCRLSAEQGIKMTEVISCTLAPTMDDGESGASDPGDHNSRHLVVDFGRVDIVVDDAVLGDDVVLMQFLPQPDDASPAYELDHDFEMEFRALRLNGDDQSSGEIGWQYGGDNAVVQGHHLKIADFHLGEQNGAEGLGQDGDIAVLVTDAIRAHTTVLDSTFEAVGNNPACEGVACLGHGLGSSTGRLVVDNTTIFGSSGGHACLVHGFNSARLDLDLVGCDGIVNQFTGTEDVYVLANLLYNQGPGPSGVTRIMQIQPTTTVGGDVSIDVRVGIVGANSRFNLLHLRPSLSTPTDGTMPQSLRAVVSAPRWTSPLLTADGGLTDLGRGGRFVDVVVMPATSDSLSDAPQFQRSDLMDSTFESLVEAEGTLAGTVRTPVGDWSFHAGAARPGLASAFARDSTVFTDMADAGSPEAVLTRQVRWDVLDGRCESTEIPPPTIQLSVGGLAVGSGIDCEGDFIVTDAWDCDGGDCTGCVADLCGVTLEDPVEPTEANGDVVVGSGGSPTTSFEVDPSTSGIEPCINTSNLDNCFWSGATNQIFLDFTVEPTGTIGLEYRGNVGETTDLSADADGQGVDPGTSIDATCSAGCDATGGDTVEISVGTSSAR